MSLFQFQTAQLTNAGGRDSNEDFCNYQIADHHGYWVLADGLGGHRGGEVAAKLAVEIVLTQCVQTKCDASETLNHAVDLAHQLIQTQQEEDPRLIKMRATLVVLASNGKEAFWAHAGDSRLYLFRDGQLLTQTKDHSVPQMLVDAGDLTTAEIRQHEDRNRLTRSLGTPGSLRLTLSKSSFLLQDKDVFLLCSDGFWDYVTEDFMETTLATSQSPQDWLVTMEQRLLQQAEPNHDNYSALAIWVSKSAA